MESQTKQSLEDVLVKTNSVTTDVTTYRTYDYRGINRSPVSNEEAEQLTRDIIPIIDHKDNHTIAKAILSGDMLSESLAPADRRALNNYFDFIVKEKEELFACLSMAKLRSYHSDGCDKLHDVGDDCSCHHDKTFSILKRI